MIYTSTDEESVFKHMGKIIQETHGNDTLIKMFNMMSGKSDIKGVTGYLQDKMAEKCVHSNVSNVGWKKLKHLANWWTSTRHLQMFRKAFTIQELESWGRLI